MQMLQCTGQFSDWKNVRAETRPLNLLNHAVACQPISRLEFWEGREVAARSGTPSSDACATQS